MEKLSPTEAFLRLSLLLVVLGLVAMVCELLAMQTPYSPYQLVLPISPFSQLRQSAFVLSLLAFALHVLGPRLEGGGARWLLFVLYALGALGTLGTLALAASYGMSAVQIMDPRPGASALFASRALFGLCLLASLLLVLRRVFRRSPQP